MRYSAIAVRRLTFLSVLAAASLQAQEVDYEQRFLAALKADLAGTSAERTLALAAPVIKGKLAPALTPVYAATRTQGKVVSVERMSPEFVTKKAVRYMLTQEKARTIVTCVFDEQGLLTGYWFKPAPPLWSLDETRARMAKWKGDYGYHRVVLDARGEVVATDGVARGRDVFPLGSVFKLYVLAELARQVKAGKVALDAAVKIDEAKKSFPSGVLHEKPDGAEVSVAEMAEKMIALSDNTATDHLMYLLGRAEIEKRLAAYKNSVPAQNTPFLTTREMFLVKGGGKEKAALGLDYKTFLRQYAEADAAKRREMLRKLTAPFEGKTIREMLMPLLGGYQIRTQFGQEHLAFEWFARPRDITALLRDARAGRLEGADVFQRFYGTGSEIYPREGLDYYGMKGGSEVHVLAFSAVATKGERTVVICVCRAGVVDPTAVPDTMQATAALMRLALEEGK